MAYDHVLAVDPGKVTGLATWSRFPGAGMPDLQSGELEFDSALKVCAGWLQQRAGESVLVVVERFDLNDSRGKAHRGTVHWPLETIGVLRWLCSARPGHDFDVQGRGAAKGFVKDDDLKSVNLHVATKGGHANDASRHLLRAMATKMQPDFERYSWV
jgi:hypothetical protein